MALSNNRGMHTLLSLLFVEQICELGAWNCFSNDDSCSDHRRWSFVNFWMGSIWAGLFPCFFFHDVSAEASGFLGKF